MVTRSTPAGPQALVLTDDGLNVTGDLLRTVTPGVGPTGEPEVEFGFNADGAFLFGQLTGQHIPTSSGLSYNLGILLDNRLLSAPTINSKITDRGTISGSMSEDDVNFLVGILQAGQLPGPGAAFRRLHPERARPASPATERRCRPSSSC